ncbi:MAG: tRNA uridine-5-carboxymethylaminomethyl(34) synthesis GTPase MnmE [Gemmatimonadales bacterium]
MLSDVIAALATPPGRSAIALVRVSGTGAHEVAAKVIPSFRINPTRCARLARVVHPKARDAVDQALYVTFRAPASYTGEDMVEISTHGGLLVPAEVIAALVAAGARHAVPGEFSRRALAHGKLDLLQAEAVADLVDATAPAQRRAALNQLDRGLSARLDRLRQEVLDLEALVCYEIDFPEEDMGPVPPERIEAAVRELETRIADLLRTAPEGERLHEGAVAVVAGRPNVGKSSLFNALVGHERAIVTEVPGTTRDAVEAWVSCEGFPFRLFDTAGLRDAGDVVERLGIEVSRRYLSGADVVLFCVEAGRDLEPAEREFLRDQSAPVLLVRTKSDLLAGKGELAQGSDELVVSTLTGEGLGELRRRLAQLAFTHLAGTADVEPVITRERHRLALERSLAEVREFATVRAQGLEGAVAATHLRAAVTALEDLIGIVTPDDVLDRVFGEFCVGK